MNIKFYFLAIFYFPGTVLHELSHYLAARLLLVPTGKISLYPKFHEDGMELGSVQIGRTDFVRRFLVGVAPLVVGISLLGLIFYLLSKYTFPVFGYVLIGYFTITILNTMSLSRSDLKGAWKVLLILVLALVLWIALH